jgi:hypothetical protein
MQRSDSPGRAALNERDLAVPLGLAFAILSALVLLSGTKVHWLTTRSLLRSEPLLGLSASVAFLKSTPVLPSS